MDFLEDLEMYEEAMENAYLIITKKLTLDDIYMKFEEDGIINKFYLPFDPMEEDGRSTDVIDMVIEYYTGTEEYEKCAELVKIKNACLKISTE
tara:strand:- start:2244 stop:2522 length:279 start_codon:yes stop_codon:yes gene_type:complete